ncbi:MAG: hypothetical protein LQ340_003273 [Diploschistes diacapsis]|nr:MAG: hypothetical protein LQ340_003273 [Diploschistes diacapsis]
MPVYAFGSNGSGQLGIGHYNDVPMPESHIAPPPVALQSPIRIAAGGNHTLILYDSGHLTCTAPKHKSSNQSESTNILAIGTKLCSATWETSVYSSNENILTVCGEGEKGELGLGEDVINVPEPGRPLSLPFLNGGEISIVHLASGLQHSVAVLSNGDVIGWGNGRKGQLGKPCEVVWKPRKVDDIPFKVIHAVCGREFTYFLGDAREGQSLVLGSDKWQIRSGAPKTVLGWRDVGASWGSIFILLDSGKIHSWGRNDHGQLAPSNLPKVDKIAVGSEHALAYTIGGDILTWGWGEHGNCGPSTDRFGDVKRGTWNTVRLPDGRTPAIRGIGAGCATSWIWT